MKIKGNYLFLAVSALIFGVSCSREAVVIIENTGTAPDMVLRHSVPVGRANPMNIQDTLSGTGDIRFRVSAQHPAFVSLQDVRTPKNRVVFPVQHGKTYRLAYDGSTFTFSGPGQEAQRLYDAIPRYSHPDKESFEYAQSSVPIKPRLDSARAAQMAPFDSLRKAHKISNDLYDLIAADRECHARNVLYRTNWYQDEEESLKIQADAFDGFDKDSDRMLGALDYFDLMCAYAELSLMDREEEIMPLIEAGENGKILLFYFDVYKNTLSGERVESTFAWQWIDFFLDQNYEKELISLYEEFKQTYPHSPYLAVMKRYYDDIVAFYAPKEISDDIQFMEDTDQIHSLDALLTRFAGRKLYVDVWATWCEPCKKEFENEDSLHELLESKGYEMLYLSVDEDRNDAKWQEMVAYYRLRGHHVRAGKALVSDLRRLFDEKGSIAIPWNMIVDTQGQIVQLHAPRPSDAAALSIALDNTK